MATAGPGLSGELNRLVETALARFTLGPDADEADEERELRRAERAVREALATQGYFDPQIRFEPSSQGTRPYLLIVELGPLTRVAQVDLRFTGALAEARFAERAEQLRAAWPLKPGTPFRSADWEAARLRLLASTEERDFAGARIVDSLAEVRPETASAHLSIEIDSGPAYTVGALTIDGLSRFEADLVERFNPFRPGDPYERAKLVEFQQLLQDTPYFSYAVATLQLSPDDPEQAPLKVVVRESRLRRFSVGVGYDTNTGARIEVAYRQNRLFGNPWVLQTGARLDQTGGLAFADVLFPPRRSGVQDSVGALVEDSELEDLFVKRWGLGAARARTVGPRAGNNVVTRWSVNFEHENRRTPTTDWQTLSSLSTTYTWVRRSVNNVIEPRSGNIIRLEGTVGATGASVDDAFVRGQGRVQHYIPIGYRDVLILRGDLGYVQAESIATVPTKFLFRTGGTTTVRGYDYESLGVKQGSATIGGRALAVASAEYVKWLERFDGNWGVAAFVDVGDAAENWGALDPALGAGLGVRFRTPAGPLAVDVAYGERERQVRVHFSVAIAF
ncbi:MAG TPA: BamA/TamA family outer membrane protein [Burkholderiaceae bacterium]|nr:BamA/TamA family outer membrane protein [Burkholderiaceae bacterium]